MSGEQLAGSKVQERAKVETRLIMNLLPRRRRVRIMMTGRKRIEVDLEKQKRLTKARNETSLFEDVKDATVASIKVI